MATKEKIKPPTKKELSDGSKLLRKGHSAGGRVMADESVAKREGVKPSPSKPTPKRKASGKRG